jgi:hypothetical protein
VDRLRNALSSASDLAPPAGRRPIKGLMFYLAGGIVYAISIGFLVIGLVPVGLITPFWPISLLYVTEIWGWHTLWIVPASWTACIALTALGVPLIDRGRRLRTRLAREVLEGDPRPPIVYLRSFKDDRASNRHPGSGQLLVTLEEQLAIAARPYGPFLAIGRPGEELPELGASRLYYHDDEWQSKVEVLLKYARAIFLVAGETPGLRWELHTICRSFDPQRMFVFLTAPLTSKRADEWGRSYETYRGWASEVLPGGLPRASGDSLFIVFDGNWNPRLVRRRRTNFLTGLLRPMMGEVPDPIRAIAQEIHRDRSFLLDRKKSGIFTMESLEQILGCFYAISMLLVLIWSYQRLGKLGLLAPVLETALILATFKQWDRIRRRSAVRKMGPPPGGGPNVLFGAWQEDIVEGLLENGIDTPSG